MTESEGAKAPKIKIRTYEWEGKPVSRSTYFRRVRLAKTAARINAANRRRRNGKPVTVVSPGDKQRAQIAAAPRPNGDQNYTTIRDKQLDRERVESLLLLLAEKRVAGGDQNEMVGLTVPRKILTAAALALYEAGYNR